MKYAVVLTPKPWVCVVSIENNTDSIWDKNDNDITRPNAFSQNKPHCSSDPFTSVLL